MLKQMASDQAQHACARGWVLGAGCVKLVIYRLSYKSGLLLLLEKKKTAEWTVINVILLAVTLVRKTEASQVGQYSITFEIISLTFSLRPTHSLVGYLRNAIDSE